jgi:branched-chain amino acid transport system permease protein
MSGEVVLMALVGGLGTIVGPVIGAFIIITMQNYLAAAGEWVTVIQGAIFVIVVLAFRRGVVGEIGAFIQHRFYPSNPEDVETPPLHPGDQPEPAHRRID